MANYDLMILNSRQTEATQSRPDYSRHELQYSERATETNARGDATKKIQYATIPLGGLAEDPKAAQSMHDIINKFRQ